MKQSLGLVAFFLTFLIQVPQAIKVVRTKKTKDLSLATYVILMAGTASWCGYGLLIGDLAIWLSNAIGFLLATLILVYKLRYG